MRTPLVVLAAITAACLIVASPALAWRRPTSAQRQAIVRVAEHAPHAGTSSVHVSDIKVSTVGPWALARLSIQVDGQPDYALAVLRRVSGHWRLTRHSPGTAGVQCGIGMPKKDIRNLDLGAC